MTQDVAGQFGGIVLCGGRSQRMGLEKATLPFGDETMLERVLRILGGVVEPLVVVAAPDQTLPPLPAGVITARDRREGRGPLEGLYAGLDAVAPSATAAFATSCDVPLLRPEFVQTMIDALGSHSVAVPVEGKFHHPLAAVYRTALLPAIQSLIAENQMRPFFLYDRVDTNRVDIDTLRHVDTDLHSLKNLNHPQDYFDALEIAGLQADTEIARRLTADNR